MTTALPRTSRQQLPACREIKVVLLGDVYVGKSSLALQFVSGEFRDFVESTIGASFMSRVLQVDEDSAPIKFQIWDTAGTEKYRSIAPMYIRGARAAMIVYDITRIETLQKARTWIQELQKVGPENVILAVVGNKCDREEERTVSAEEGQKLADEFDAFFIETSAKNNTNILQVFTEIGRRLPGARPGLVGTRSIRIFADETSQEKPASKKCCM